MAGAFTALGADFGNLNINPAGLGLFTRSQLQITPALQFFDTDAYLLGSNNKQMNTNLSIGSLGLVLYSDHGGKTLSSFSFGFGYNTMQQHRRHINASGYNAHNSITNFFADEARNISHETLAKPPGHIYGVNDYAGMAYNTFIQPDSLSSGIIDWWGDRGSEVRYIGAFQYGGINQSLDRLEKGRTNEWGISFAGNFDDRFHLGLTLGIVDVSYSMVSVHKETDTRGNYDLSLPERMKLHSISFTEELTQSGLGINLTVGAIYQPTDFLRFGLMAKTPSAISLTDVYSNRMNITGDNGESANNKSAQNTFDFTLYTPAQVNFGAAVILKNYLLLGLDYGMMSFRSASFSSSEGGDAGYFQELNSAIKNQFTNVFNVRFGAEVRIMENIYLRGGFGYYASPYSVNENKFADLGSVNPNSIEVPVRDMSSARMVYSGGIGFKGEKFFFDATFFLHDQTDKLRLYTVIYPADPTVGNGDDYSKFYNVSPVSINQRTWARLSFTIGINFGGGK